jgi:parallel beta-helix repeat protein
MPADMKALAAAAAALSCIAFGAAPALAAGPGCGGVVKKSTTLQRDLTNCPGDGLVIGADNLKLDLGGHTIDGTGTLDTAGIRLARHHGVTIQHGKVQEFDLGVLFEAADGNAVRRITAIRNASRGIQLESGSDGNRVEFVVANANALSGIVVFLSERNVIAHAISSHNTFNGFTASTAGGNRIVDSTFAGNTTGIGLANSSNHNVVAGNVVSDSTEASIAISGDDNLVTGNRSEHNGWGIDFSGDRNQILANVVRGTIGCSDGDCGAGIDLNGGARNLIASNVVNRTIDEGIRLHEFEADGGAPVVGNAVRGNVVRNAGRDGIALQIHTDEITGQGTLKDNLIQSNLVIDSRHDGINVGRPTNTVSRNVVVHNDALGIEAVPGVIDGGGNLAFGNGDPRQCQVVACR